MLRRRKVPQSLDALLEEAATAEHRPAEPAAEQPGPEEAAVEAEPRRRVLTALAGLPDHYRTALLLKDGLGLCAEGVAEAMGLTVAAVRSILHRARSGADDIKASYDKGVLEVVVPKYAALSAPKRVPVHTGEAIRSLGAGGPEG